MRESDPADPGPVPAAHAVEPAGAVRHQAGHLADQNPAEFVPLDLLPATPTWLGVLADPAFVDHSVPSVHDMYLLSYTYR